MSEKQCIKIPIKDGQTEFLVSWLSNLQSRKRELIEALTSEGIQSEMVLLERGQTDYILIYTKADDLKAANQGFQTSLLPVDIEFKKVMQQSLDLENITKLEIMLEIKSS